MGSKPSSTFSRETIKKSLLSVMLNNIKHHRENIKIDTIMKKALITLFILTLCSQLAAQNYQRTSQGIKTDVIQQTLKFNFLILKL